MSPFEMDRFTAELMDRLFEGGQSASPDANLKAELHSQYAAALEQRLTKPALDFFERL